MAARRSIDGSIVGLIGEHRQGFGRLDEFTQIGNKDCNARKRVADADEPPGENAEELVEHGTGVNRRARVTSSRALCWLPPCKSRGLNPSIRRAAVHPGIAPADDRPVPDPKLGAMRQVRETRKLGYRGGRTGKRGRRAFFA